MVHGILCACDFSIRGENDIHGLTDCVSEWITEYIIYCKHSFLLGSLLLQILISSEKQTIVHEQRARRIEAIALHILGIAYEIVRYKNYVHVFDGVCKILLISLIENTATD